jgi:P4 family phage/plasmid primase-like protien
MRDQDYSASLAFLKNLFSECGEAIELRACPNVKGVSGALSEMTDTDVARAAFCARKDVEGIGTYFGVCTRLKGSEKGNLQSVAEMPALWVDIDCKKQGLAGDDVLACLSHLPFPPSITINSGGGLHAYWQLEEPLDVTDGSRFRDGAVNALKSLARILAGDMKCAELARIMRLPGTMNSKPETCAIYDGQPFVCEIIETNGRVYSYQAICEWLVDQRALLHGKTEAAHPVREDDPFVKYAREAGYEPAIDIEQSLSDMVHGSTGINSIHQTQLRVSMSMIARGYEDDDIIDRILAATESAAPGDAKWNWSAEEKAIREMVRSGRSKTVEPKGRTYLKYDKAPDQKPQRAAGSPALKLVHSAKPAAKPKVDKSDKQTDLVALGHSVIQIWNDRYGPILHMGGNTYCYSEGIWEQWDDIHAQKLRTIIQEGCEALHINPTTSILNGARAYVMDRPALYRDDIRFDRHGLLIAADACLDLKTLEIIPHSPEHFARFKVAASINGEKDCPEWKSFLSGAFGDRSCGPDIVMTLQEWFGASIAPMKSRPLLKGMLVHGPSRSGKTQVSKVMRALLGEQHICNAMMRDLEGRFGKEPLIGKRGWIADDAIGAKEYLDAETYKVLVTGETTSAQIKGGKNIEFSFGYPVMLTANNLPRVNDKSDATYNRSLILPMTVVRPEDAPEPEGFNSIAEKIVRTELTGVLWWAIKGRIRLAERGRFAAPSAMIEATQSFQDANDPIGTWIRQCVEPDHKNRVARSDLSTSFFGWWEQESEDSKITFAANTVSRQLQARFPGLADLKSNGTRMFGGIRLNDEGKDVWAMRAADFNQKAKAFSTSREEINRPWDGFFDSAPRKMENHGKTIF